MVVNWRETAQIMLDVAGKTDDLDAKRVLIDQAGKIIAEALTPAEEDEDE